LVAGKPFVAVDFGRSSTEMMGFGSALRASFRAADLLDSGESQAESISATSVGGIDRGRAETRETPSSSPVAWNSPDFGRSSPPEASSEVV
jgi:hypothetical protein